MRRHVSHDSHNRLFGAEVERTSATPKHQGAKSNIPIGSDAIDAPKATNGKSNGNGQASNGNGYSNGNNNGFHHDNHKVQNGDHVNGGHVNGNGIKPGIIYTFDLRSNNNCSSHDEMNWILIEYELCMNTLLLNLLH